MVSEYLDILNVIIALVVDPCVAFLSFLLLYIVVNVFEGFLAVLHIRTCFIFPCVSSCRHSVFFIYQGSSVKQLGKNEIASDI